MAQFKHIPAARIVHQESVEGRDENGAIIRLALVVTEKVAYLQRYLDGVGVSTTQFSGARLADAPSAYAQAALTELGVYTGSAPANPEPVAEAPLPTNLPHGSPEWQATAEAWLATVSADAEEPAAELAAEAQPARPRGPNRPDDEQQVWAEGDLAVVMIQGREFRYDLRRGAATIESVRATRNWRQERRDLIAKGAGLLAVAA